ncbi:MAG TPA: hypothetical protein VMX74_08355, partial [Pirellulales bacterium]|nr:hypothetical protein [Pirellulales bacterium]
GLARSDPIRRATRVRRECFVENRLILIPMIVTRSVSFEVAHYPFSPGNRNPLRERGIGASWLFLSRAPTEGSLFYTSTCFHTPR